MAPQTNRAYSSTINPRLRLGTACLSLSRHGRHRRGPPRRPTQPSPGPLGYDPPTKILRTGRQCAPARTYWPR
jgi:hypothetical protein